MRSFIIQTDVGQMILTLKYYGHNQTFRVYLHGVCNDTTCDGVAFYEDQKSFFIEPNRDSIFEAAKKLVSYHYFWKPESQLKFRKFLFQLWKECHQNLLDKDGIPLQDNPPPSKFWII